MRNVPGKIVLSFAIIAWLLIPRLGLAGWESKAPLPIARSSLATATFKGTLYAIIPSTPLEANPEADLWMRSRFSRPEVSNVSYGPDAVEDG